MKRTNTTNDTSPQPKRSMTSTQDLDPNTAALAEQERQRTLVFIGLPESNATRPSERVQEDREAAIKILDHLEVEAQPTAIFRLGRYDQKRTTPRPLKVVMPTPTHQHVALGGWKRERARLRSQQNMARLFVRPALTKEQLKKEYEERVRKPQQIPAPVAPAVQLPQANAPTPVNEVEPEQKKASEDTSKSSQFDKAMQNEIDKALLQIQSFQKELTHLLLLDIEQLSAFAEENEGSKRYSETVYRKGVPWKIKAKVNTKKDSTEKCLGFYLLYTAPKESINWSCKYSAKLQIVSQKSGTEDLTLKFSKIVFNNKSLSWGFPNFISFAELMDPSKGLYDEEGDKVTLAIGFNEDSLYSKIKSFFGKLMELILRNLNAVKDGYCEKQKRTVFNVTFVKWAAEFAHFHGKSTEEEYPNFKLVSKDLFCYEFVGFDGFFYFDQSLGQQIANKFKSEFFSSQNPMAKVVKNQILQLALSLAARILLCVISLSKLDCALFSFGRELGKRLKLINNLIGLSKKVKKNAAQIHTHIVRKTVSLATTNPKLVPTKLKWNYSLNQCGTTQE
ncbi:hypothetical protein niasHT_028468 [Heterodera trifolii]|uniref:MATH domain-containing protein n=1 Tax=Heterodera trifolii TaxID=157864 RepID=A0ABD2KQ01_9BILA